MKSISAQRDAYETGRMESETSQWEAEIRQRVDDLLETGSVKTPRTVLEALGDRRTDEIYQRIKEIMGEQNKNLAADREQAEARARRNGREEEHDKRQTNVERGRDQGDEQTTTIREREEANKDNAWEITF